jgi:hypothetical protein
MKKIINLLIALFVLGGCYPYQYMGNTTAVHNYSVSVVDIDEKPIKEAKVYCNLHANRELLKKDTLITDSNGYFSCNINLSEGYVFYSSEIEYIVSKEGYYKKSGNFSNSELTSKTITDNKTITLIKPVDYFNRKFYFKFI